MCSVSRCLNINHASFSVAGAGPNTVGTSRTYSSTLVMAFLADLCAKATEKQRRPSPRLQLASAQRLVAVQELDGRFDANALSFKLGRIWDLLVPATPMPHTAGDGGGADHGRLYASPASGPLSEHPADATVLVLLLFERYANGAANFDVAAEFFGSAGIRPGREWLDAATKWLESTCPSWRDSRVFPVAKIADAWFDEGNGGPSSHHHRGTFVDEKRRVEARDRFEDKFGSVERVARARGDRWLQCAPFRGRLDSVPWEAVSAIGWILGGEGGVYQVRIGEDQKLCVKHSVGVGDVLYEELLGIVDGVLSSSITTPVVQTAPMRFLAPGTEEYARAEKYLLAATPDEPEILERLRRRVFQKSKQDGNPLMIMVHVEGECLHGLEGSRLLREGREEPLRSLGRTISLDCLTNNWDRFPALPKWPRKGNLGNVLVTKMEAKETAMTLVFIDQTVTLLSEEKDREEHFRALGEFAAEVAKQAQRDKKNGGVVGPGMDRIRTAVRRSCPLWTGDPKEDAKIYEQQSVYPEGVVGVELNDEDCALLYEGMSQVFARASEIRKVLTKSRASVSSSCLSAYSLDGGSKKLSSGVEALLTFVDGCLGAVEESYKCV